MKKFFKNFDKVTIAIIVLGIFLRFYQLEIRTNFTADQGRDYLVVHKMISNKKPTLLGPKASVGEFYFGPLYYYLLIPPLLVGKFDPLAGAIFTAGLDSFSLILFALLAKKILVKKSVFFAVSLYATFPLLVSMVKVPLNPFVIPFFSVLFLICLLNAEYLLLNTLGVGFVAGLLFQLHFSTAPLIAIGLFAMLLKKEKLLRVGSFLCGLLVGIAPMALFDIRHQLFNSTNIIKYVSGGGGGNISEHYFIAFFPLAFILVSKIVHVLPQRVINFLTIIIVLFNTLSYLQPVHSGYLMTAGWNLPGIRQAVKYIAADNPQGRFAVAATLDGDTRAMPYRYLLEAKYSKIPLGVEEYPLAETLYVVTREPAQKVIANPVWEISSIQPTVISKTWTLQNSVLMHKLEKI